MPTSYSYRSSGLLKEFNRGNGVNTGLGYDTASRLTSIHHDLAGNPLLHLDYLLDNNGNRTQLSDSDGVTTYLYDQLNRLTDVNYPAIAGGPTASSSNYQMDAVGNRTQQISNGSSTGYSYDASDRITNPGFSYDNNGNLLSDGNATYSYDAANRLTSMTQNGVTVNYSYDGWGNLIQQSSNGVTIDYVLDENGDLPRILGEVRSDGTEKLYAYGPEGFAAQKHAVGPAQVEYPLLDGLGSVRRLSDATGNVTLSRSYDAYGEVRYSSGGGYTAFGFTGELQDATGLVYLRARHYNPVLGRFLQRDSFGGFPANAQSLHRYTYTGSNPALYTDPSGHCPICISAGVGAAVGGGFAYGSQVYQNYQDGARGFDMFAVRDGNEIIAAAGAGAVTGAVAPFMAPLGWAGDFVDGAIGGGVNQLLLNWLRGCQLMQGVFEAAGEGAAWGGAAGAAGRSARKMAKPLSEAAGQAFEDFGGTWGRKARQVFDDATAPLRQAVGECFNSFSAETPVATEEGTQAISTLDIGDQVLAWDEATGETGYYTVTATLVHNDPLMVYLTIVSPELAEGGEIVQTTPEHPFYVVEGSEWSAYLSVGKWVDAGELQSGDAIRQADGTTGIVSEVNVVVAAQVMYNLTVDQAHTFFVGDGLWLVHNADCYQRPAGYRKGVRDKVWENAKGPDGNVRDPLTGEIMDKEQPWDMGHKPGYEYRKHRQSAEERGIDRKSVV